MSQPQDADARRMVKPVICYPVHTLPEPDMELYSSARATLTKVAEYIAPARDAVTFNVKAGQFFSYSLSGRQSGWGSEPLECQ